jgi:tetratricopeptide (TPR) repeat protein
MKGATVIKCPKCQSENPESKQFCGDCGTPLPCGPSPRAVPPEMTETFQKSGRELRELATGAAFAGRYQIIEELGKGGMGRVYRALDTKLKEEIALKLIMPEISSDRDTVERFGNELKLARKIAHRNVGKMYEFLEDRGTHFITMEYVPGQDLRRLIRQTGQLTAGKTVAVARQVADGLAEAHRLGVVHRDLKPGNIMIDREGNAKIMDFGIARSLSAKSMTGAGVIVGTPEYMSPEQVEGKAVDRRSDIYSLGIILYEMLTGRVPFEGDTPFTVGVKHKSELPKDPRELNAQIPPDLNRLILKCLEKDKDGRYQSAEELDADLEKIEKGIPTTERFVPKAKPFTSREITVKFSLKKLLVPALAVIGLAAAVVLLWRFIPKKEAAPAALVENSVAVITFENQTGDRAYDYLQKAIPNLLITQLEQTGSFYVATWARLHDLLKQMKKGDLEVIDPDSGFDLCRRDGIKALVLGTYTKAGNMFVTDVKVLDVATKKLVKSASTKGEGVDSILRSQIDDLGREIAQGLGSAFRAGQKKVIDVTTTSFEAYNFYLKGMEEYDRFNNDQARKFLEKAVELDPSFARAHHVLSFVYFWLGQSEASEESLMKAMALKDKLTEEERLTIEADYALEIEHDQDKYFRLQKQAAEKYPKEKRILRELGTIYVSSGDLDKAEQEFRAALELDPDFSPALISLSEVMVMRGEYAQALEVRRRWASRAPGNPDALDALGDIYFLLGENEEAMAKFKEALMFVPGYISSVVGLQYISAQKEDYSQALDWLGQLLSEQNPPRSLRDGRLWRAFYCTWLGKHEEALAELREISTLAAGTKDEYTKYVAEVLKAWIWYDRGRADLFWIHYQDGMNAFLKTNPEFKRLTMYEYQFGEGLAALMQSRLGQARQKLAELRSLVPKLPKLEYWTEWQKDAASKQDILSAEICLAEKKPKESIAILQKAPPRPCPFFFYFTEDWLRYNFPFEQDTLARACAQNGEPEKAIAEYERLTTYNPKSESRFLIHPRYHYRLARLYEQRGLKEKAAARYQKFLELWKDADSGQPEVEDAKRRLAGLKGI